MFLRYCRPKQKKPSVHLYQWLSCLLTSKTQSPSRKNWVYDTCRWIVYVLYKTVGKTGRKNQRLCVLLIETLLSQYRLSPVLDPLTASSDVTQKQKPHLNQKLLISNWTLRDSVDNDITVELQKYDTCLRTLEETCPLYQRGCTLQVSALSPRQLYYGKHTIYWRCPQGLRGDNSVSSASDMHDCLPRIMYSDVLREPKFVWLDTTIALSEYYKLVKEYTRRRLTVE
jgi:hypothetical protein